MGGLNAQIAQGFQRKPINPIEDAARIAQLRQAAALLPGQVLAQQQALTASQQENQVRQNDLNEYQGFKDALAKHNGDLDAAMPDIVAAAPTRGVAIQKALIDNRKNIAETTKANADAQRAALDAADKQSQLITQGMQGLDALPPDQQQPEYVGRLAALHAAGIDTSKMPIQYDPATVGAWIAKGTTIQQQIDQRKQALAEKQFKINEPKLTAEAQQSQLTQASQALGAAKSQADWDAAYEKLAPELQQRFGPQFSPAAAQRATELGLTPDQRIKAIQEGGLSTATPQEFDTTLKSVTQGNAQAYAQFAPQLQFYAQKGDQTNARKVLAAASSQIGEIAKEQLQKPPQQLLMVPNGEGGATAMVAGPGTTVPAGAVSAAAYSSQQVPTAATRTMAETAPKVIDLANRVGQLVDSQVNTLGPAASRWQEFMAGKVGAPNEEFTKLRTDVGLLQTALMRMHVGARGGERIMEHFQNLIDASKQSPENLKAALGEIQAYAQEVASSWKSSSTPQTPVPAPVAAKVQGGYIVGRKYGNLTYQGGDPNSQANWK